MTTLIIYGSVSFNPSSIIVSSIASLFTGKIKYSIEKKRILKLFEEFGNCLKDIEKDLHNYKDYLNSEPCYDLIRLTIEKTIRERHTEKIKIYSKILKGAITSIDTDYDNRTSSYEEYVNIVSQLAITDIKILKDINNKAIDDKFNLYIIDPSFDPPKTTQLEDDDIRYSITKLEKFGLIVKESDIKRLSRKYSSGENVFQYYIKSKYFNSLIQFIKERG